MDRVGHEIFRERNTSSYYALEILMGFPASSGEIALSDCHCVCTEQGDCSNS